MYPPIVLSIDIDYFVTPFVGAGKIDGPRLPDELYSVRGEGEVKQFLEQRCLLSTLDRTRGDVITHHDEAFDKIKEGFETNHFTTAVDIFHVDAHADEHEGGHGHGWGEMPYLLGELMHKPVAERSTVRRGKHGLDCSNWLTFCVASQWIETVRFLRHANNNYGLVPFYFPETYSDPSLLQLMELIPVADPETFFHSMISFEEQISTLRQYPDKERGTPWLIQKEEQFQLPSKPDYVIVCQSPGFTPQKADVLIDLARDYLK